MCIHGSEGHLWELVPSSTWVLGIELKLHSCLKASILPAKPSHSLSYIFMFSCFFCKGLLTFIVHAWVFVSMYISTICVWYLWRPQEGIREGLSLNICPVYVLWTHGKQRRVSEPLELEFQEVITCMMGNKTRSSAENSVVNLWAISLTRHVFLYFHGIKHIRICHPKRCAPLIRQLCRFC